MYDTFPDEARMMGQTGIRLSFLYITDLQKYTEKVAAEEAQCLADQLYKSYEVVEPSKEEVLLGARQAIGLERQVQDAGIDALAIDMFPVLTPACGMLPALGMARLIDQGVVVTTEGDLSTAAWRASSYAPSRATRAISGSIWSLTRRRTSSSAATREALLASPWRSKALAPSFGTRNTSTLTACRALPISEFSRSSS